MALTPEQEKQARIARQMFQNMLDELDLPGFVEAQEYRLQRSPWAPKPQQQQQPESQEETQKFLEVLAEARSKRGK